MISCILLRLLTRTASRSVTFILLLFISYSCNKDEIPGIIFNPSVTYGTMTDQDGNTYKTVTIGTQVWMAENLRTTKYRDGTPLLHVTGDNQWVSTITGAYCYYDNNIRNSVIYGCLYNWYSVSNTLDLAPEGWHVATDGDWAALVSYLGGESVAGGKLKEKGSAHWDCCDKGNIATNESGFTALPGGWRNELFMNRTFWYQIYYGRWWCNTEDDPEKAWSRELYYGSTEISRFSDLKFLGLSVRCVKN